MQLFVFDVIEVVPEPGEPQTNHKLKFLAEKEYKSPITAIAESNGYIVACIGQKIIIHTFDKTETLAGVAFIDQQVYVTSVCAIKNTILIGDVLKSAWFLRMTVSARVFLPKRRFALFFDVFFFFFFFLFHRIIRSVWRSLARTTTSCRSSPPSS